MTETARGGGRLVDALLVIVLLAAIAARAWRIADGNCDGPDLNPRPDALEYALAAESLVEHGDLTLDLEGVRYPTRYPPGFAFALAPIVAACGVDRAWFAALAAGSLTVLICAILGRLAAGRIGFLIAGSIMLLSPASIRSSSLAMSETTSQLAFAVCLLGAALLQWRAPTPRRTLFTIACGVAAFGGLVRYTNLAFALPLVALALRRAGDDPAPRRRSLVAISVGVPAAALLAIGVRNSLVFGHPLHDGYRFWVPELYASGLTFSLSYLVAPLAGLFPTGNLAAYARELSGVTQNLFTIPIALAALVGGWRVVVARKTCAGAASLAVAMWLTAPAIVGFYLVYAWQDARFLEPLVPLVAVLAAVGIAAIGARFGRLAATVIGMGLVAHLGYVARPLLTPRDPGRLERLPLVDYCRNGRSLLGPVELAIADFDPALVRAGFGRDFELVASDLESAAPHFARVADRDLVGRDGQRATMRALTRKNQVVESEVASIADAIRRGKRVVFLEATHEGKPGSGIERLRSEFEFEEVRLLPGMWLFEAWIPPVRAFELRIR